MSHIKERAKRCLNKAYSNASYSLKMLLCFEPSLSVSDFCLSIASLGWEEESSDDVDLASVHLVILLAPINKVEAFNEMRALLQIGLRDDSPFCYSMAICEDKSADSFELLLEAEIDDSIAAHEQGSFSSKVHSITRQVLKYRQRDSALNNANQVALSAMAMASDLGRVVNFIEHADSAQTPSELAHRVLSCLQAFSLEGTVCILGENEKFWATSWEDRLDYHKRALNLSTSRIVTHGKFILINFNHVGLLVANAPANDEDQMGRLRDSLAHIANVAEVKARNLILNDFLSNQHDEIMRIMTLVQRMSQDSSLNIRDIMQRLSNDIATEAVSSNLDEDQEARLIKLSEDALQSLEDLYQFNDALEDHLAYLIESIEQARLKAMTANPAPTEPTPSASSDVELF